MSKLLKLKRVLCKQTTKTRVRLDLVSYAALGALVARSASSSSSSKLVYVLLLLLLLLSQPWRDRPLRSPAIFFAVVTRVGTGNGNGTTHTPGPTPELMERLSFITAMPISAHRNVTFLCFCIAFLRATEFANASWHRLVIYDSSNRIAPLLTEGSIGYRGLSETVSVRMTALSAAVMPEA
jgi:hypothetical protein